MERSLFFLILILGIIWVVFDEIWGDKKIITKVVKGLFA